MSQARAIQLAEAVKDELNAADFSMSATAERAYSPVFDMDQLRDLQLSVIPWNSDRGGTATERTLTRGELRGNNVRHQLVRFEISVGVQKKFNVSNDIAECDELMFFCEEIGDHFDGWRDDTLDAICQRVTSERFFDAAWWRQNQIFARFIRLHVDMKTITQD